MPELPPDSDPTRPGPERPREEPVDSDLRPIEELLWRERPVPRAAFIAELRGRLVRAPRERRRAGSLILAYATSGFALLAVAVLGVAGAGPLAA